MADPEKLRALLCFFQENPYGYHFEFLKYAFPAVVLCCAALGVQLLLERQLGKARTLLALGLAVVYPLAGNLIEIMAPAGTHTLMIYGLSYILIAPVALADYSEINWRKISQKVVQAIAGWIIFLTIAATAYAYAITANEAYLKIDLSLRQCTAYSTVLLGRIESCEGYRIGMPVMLMGNQTREERLSPTPQMDSVDLTGVFDLAGFRTSYTYNYFLRNYLGYSGEVYIHTKGFVENDEASVISKKDEVRDMPLYPEKGSVQIIDGWVVVKLNEDDP